MFVSSKYQIDINRNLEEGFGEKEGSICQKSIDIVDSLKHTHFHEDRSECHFAKGSTPKKKSRKARQLSGNKNSFLIMKKTASILRDNAVALNSARLAVGALMCYWNARQAEANARGYIATLGPIEDSQSEAIILSAVVCNTVLYLLAQTTVWVVSDMIIRS